MTRLLREQRAPELVRILARRVRHLVDERLGEEIVLRIPDRTPEPRADAGRILDPIDVDVRHRIRRVGQAFDRRAVDAVLDERGLGTCSDRERLAHGARLDHDRIAVGVEAARHFADRHRAVVVALGIVFTRVDDFHRRVGGLRKLDRLHEEILPEAAAEAAAEERGVHFDPLGLQAGHLRGDELIDAGRLGRRPDLGFIRLDPGDAVHRFHARVREIRHLVNGFHGFRRLHRRHIAVHVRAFGGANAR